MLPVTETTIRILLVEDSPADAELILLQLKKDGLKVDHKRVETENEFTASLAWTPDLILSDYVLPHFSGTRALEIVREMELDIPFILISGAVEEDTIIDVFKQGVDDYVMKDHLGRLAPAIHHAIEQKHMREEKRRSEEALRASEERYRSIFENSTVAMLEEDFSDIKAELDRLRANGMVDVGSYIKEHPEFLEWAVKQVKILDVNQSMLRLYNIEEKAEMLGPLDQVMSPENFQEELIAFAEGITFFEREIRDQTGQGRHLDLLLTVTYYPESAGRHKALVHMTDITARKKAEEGLRGQNKFLALLNEMNRVILASDDYDSIMHSLAFNLKDIIDADDCYILRWNDETKQPLPVITTAKLDFSFTDGESYPEGLSVAASILRVGHVIAIEDVYNSPHISVEIVRRYPARSIIGIPLIIGNQKLGVAIIAFNSHHSFTQDELERAEQAGNQVAVALLDLQQHLEIQRRLRESNALTEISRALSETERIGTDEVLQLIVDSARDLIGQAEESVIHLVDADAAVLIPMAISGFASGAKASERHWIGLKEGVAGHVIATGETVNIGDINASPLYILKDTAPRYRSLLVAPVQRGGQPIGTISVQSNKLNAFSASDTKLLNSLSIQAAIAIENTRLFEITQQSLREVNALYLTGQGLASSLDTDELIKGVVNLLQKNFDYYHVQIYLLDSENRNLILKSGSGEIGAQMLMEEHYLPIGTGIVGHTVETATPFVTNNVNDVMFFFRNPLLPDTQSEITAPIKVDGKVVGAIDIQERPPRKLTDNDMQLVVAVADQLSVALHKASLYTNLQNALQQEQTVRSQLVQSERLALVGRLLASVSHELNNPLQAIQNALFLLKDEENLSLQGKQDLDVILSEAERMASLIERLRTAYRPGRVKDFRPVELNDLIEDVHTLISTFLRQKQIAFEFHPDPDLLPISGMSDQMRQVVLNLFLNAIEVMEPGGRIIVRTLNLIQQNEVLLTVKDTGPGIDQSILPRIFDAFITDKQTGTGLGLTITRDIIEQHFGRIEAENDPEGGAVFNVWLPIDGKRQE